MPKYRVVVVRTEWRAHEFTVEQATDEYDARRQALKQACSFNFEDGTCVGYMASVEDSPEVITEPCVG